MATTIIVDDRTIRIPETRDPSPQQACERTLERIYGRGAFMRPRNGRRWERGGQTFHDYVDVYRTNPRRGGDGWSASLVASHVWVAVNNEGHDCTL